MKRIADIHVYQSPASSEQIELKILIEPPGRRPSGGILGNRGRIVPDTDTDLPTVHVVDHTDLSDKLDKLQAEMQALRNMLENR